MTDTLPEMLASVFALLGAFFLARQITKKLHLAIAPFVISLLWWSFAAITLILVDSLTSAPLHPDAVYYSRWAEDISNSLVTGDPVVETKSIWPGSGVWSSLMAMAILLLGSSEFFPIFINVALLSYSLLVCQVILKKMAVKVGHSALTVIFLSNPAILFNGPTLLREGLQWFSISLLMLGIVSISKSEMKTGLTSLLFGCLLQLGIRPNLGIFIVYFFLLSAIVLWAKVIRTKEATVLSSALIIAISLVSVAVYPSMTGRSDLAKYAVGASKELNSEANSGFKNPSFTDSETNESVPTLIPSICGINQITNALCLPLINLPSFLFGPFPWELELRPVYAYALLSTWHFLLLLGLSIAGLFRDKLKNPLATVLVLLAIVLSMLLATTLTNYGIVARFRVIIEMLLAPPAAIGLQGLLKVSNSKN